MRVAHLHVKELLFVGAPNRVIDAVVIANQPQGFVGVVLELHARLDRHVAEVSIDTFRDRLNGVSNLPRRTGVARRIILTNPQYSMAACSVLASLPSSTVNGTLLPSRPFLEGAPAKCKKVGARSV